MYDNVIALGTRKILIKFNCGVSR